MTTNRSYSPNREVLNYKFKNQLIQQLKQRFTTYGYEQVHTPTFEDYDMYTSIQNTVNKDEMIKVIDRSGKVLVLRPDGTIPITRLTASERKNGEIERLFYIFNVYRQLNQEDERKESTQAGVELFGNNEPEADAEVISLAVHTLKEIGFDNFKLEIGHAGLFKELIEQANLSVRQEEELQELIQAKNIVEMKPFLEKLSISQALEQALSAIPLLYGKPETILKETEAIIQNERMQSILHHLRDVMDVLMDDGSLDYITLNLGLINNMDYYTDIIFQGFVEEIGSPVLMGGRYDQLSQEFGKATPAIGFAYEVDSLLQAMKQHHVTKNQHTAPPLPIYYTKKRRTDAFYLAEELRKDNTPVITERINEKIETNGVILTEKESIIKDKQTKYVDSNEEVIDYLQAMRGENWSWKN
jgi:ATP phosphoribosyltransferase regulatory subunit